MREYVYLWHVKWSQKCWDMHYADPNFGSNWFSKLRDICKEKGVKVLFNGGAYGTDYNTIIGYKTAKPLGEFVDDVISKILDIEQGMTDMTKTTIVLLIA